MIHFFKFIEAAQTAVALLLLCMLLASKESYGFQNSPIVFTTTGIWHSTPEESCNYWASRRDIEYVGIPRSQQAEIKDMWVIPWAANGEMNALPAVHYQCGVRIFHYGNPPYQQPYEYDWRFGGAYPVCKVGDGPSSTINSDTVCNIPDHIPDRGANLGQPATCVGNPINAATGNKFDQQIDVVLPTFTFSRFYNSFGFSSNGQIGMSWRHSFQSSLSINSTTITATRADGKLIYFRLEGTNWINQQASGDSLVHVTDGNGSFTGWVLTTADDRKEYYNPSGNLIAIADRAGRLVSLNYDTNHRLIAVADDVGRSLNFTYDGSSRIKTITDPAGSIYQYSYDIYGNLVSVTYPDGKIRTYHYNESAYTSGANLPHALTGISDEKGMRFAIYHYDTQGRAIFTEHAQGAERYHLTYNPGNTMITDPLGTQRTHHFQTFFGVAKNAGQSQPAGSGCTASSSSLDYDEQGNMVSQTDFNGNKTCYAYDLNRNLEIARVEGLSASQSCPTDIVSHVPALNSAERRILTSWHSTFQLPLIITEPNRETKIDYDSHGNITRYHLRDLSSTASRTWTLSYQYHTTVPGLILQTLIDGPRTDLSDITVIDFYLPDANCIGNHAGCNGQIQRITNALGHQTQIVRYNAHGQIEEMIDPNGLVTTILYDARQRVLNRVIGTEITSYEYDSAGQLVKVISPDGSSLSYSYDAAHRLIEIKDSLSNRITYTLDSMGNRIKEDVFDLSGTLIQTHRSEYDALGRLWKSVGAQNEITELGYDANGNLKQSLNPLAFMTIGQFDTLDRLTQITDPAQGLTRLQYNHQDEIIQVAAPNGASTRYTYNGLGDLIREESADRGLIKYTYDSAGNLKTVTDARGVRHTYFYDALNRPLKRSHSAIAGIPGTTIPTWNYDAGVNETGQLTSITDSSGSTQFSYDQQGRLVRKVQTTKVGTASLSHTLGYTYDQTGKLTQTTYPSGAQITTLYGIDGRPNEIQLNGTTLIRDIAYQPFGAVKRWIWSNNQTHTRQFDMDGRLIRYPHGNSLRTVHFDEAGRLAQYLHTDTPALNRSFMHDGLDRLTSEVGGTSMSLWTYDANGNRITSQPGNQLYIYEYLPNSNRLISISSSAVESYSYDLAGNIISDGSTSYTYNTGGRLYQVNRSGKINRYFYNAFGERVIKTGAWLVNGPYRFVYDSDGKLIGEYDKNGLRQETVWLDDTPIAVIKKNSVGEFTVYQIHTDHLNTPRAILDSQHRVVWQWYSGAFGETLPEEDPDGDGIKFEYNPRFPGQYWDKETNLHYNYFRDYDPGIGRYIQSDPIGLLGGLNTYGYVEQNPLSFTDPTGEAIPILICIANPWCRGMLSGVTQALGNLGYQLARKGQCPVDFREVASWGLNGITLSFGVGAGLNGGVNSVFWSGDENAKKAKLIGRPIASTPIGALMNNRVRARWVWAIASAIYAGNAKGTVIKVGTQAGKIWANVELVILRRRGISIKIIS